MLYKCNLGIRSNAYQKLPLLPRRVNSKNLRGYTAHRIAKHRVNFSRLIYRKKRMRKIAKKEKFRRKDNLFKTIGILYKIFEI